MKRIFLLTLLVSTLATAQRFSYGAIVGANFYEVMNNSGTISNFKQVGGTAANIGVYGEFNFTNKLGIKTEITFNKKEIERSISYDRFYFSIVEVAPSLKYDFGQEYRQGFYILMGPKFSLITKATSNGINVKDAFETTNVGLQFGVGRRFLEFFDIEGKVDYELTPFYKVDGGQSDFFAFYLNLGVDLERVFNKI